MMSARRSSRSRSRSPQLVPMGFQTNMDESDESAQTNFESITAFWRYGGPCTGKTLASRRGVCFRWNNHSDFNLRYKGERLVIEVDECVLKPADFFNLVKYGRTGRVSLRYRPVPVVSEVTFVSSVHPYEFFANCRNKDSLGLFLRSINIIHHSRAESQ